MGTKGEGNRQRIIEAADRLFYQRGYNQTSFQDISDATGIPRGNFYYYFKTKDEILDAVVQARSAHFVDMLKQHEAATADPRERLLKLADMLDVNQDMVVDAGCPLGSLSSELAKEGTALQHKSRQVFDVVRQWAAAQFAALGRSDADELAMELLARIQGVTVIACAFKDAAFLQRSLKQIKAWLVEVSGG
ncbi:MAG TPA: TetR/AcrR family transcriptional regulator [Thiotrichales bacterium]|nr:TetR/AcrR family transcriptional regulator [Thiotrichales bacterium]